MTLKVCRKLLMCNEFVKLLVFELKCVRNITCYRRSQPIENIHKYVFAEHLI